MQKENIACGVIIGDFLYYYEKFDVEALQGLVFLKRFLEKYGAK